MNYKNKMDYLNAEHQILKDIFYNSTNFELKQTLYNAMGLVLQEKNKLQEEEQNTTSNNKELINTNE